MPVEQLSGVTVVIIIAVCFEACIVLFMFAKRQIMRFALRNRRGPHMHIGHGGPKYLRREADRRLDYVPYIKYEPPLTCLSQYNMDTVKKLPSHYYRVKAVELYRFFEREMAAMHPNYVRLPGTNVRSFLVNCMSGGPLAGVDPKLVHQVCDDYYFARQHYEEFGKEKYETYKTRLEILRREISKGQPINYKSQWTPNLKKRSNNPSTPTGNVELNQRESSAVILNSGMLSISTPV